MSSSNNSCSVCNASEQTFEFVVLPKETTIPVCNTCKNQLEHTDKIDANHWRCLNDSIWSENTAVQVVSWRMLQELKDENWAVDLLDKMYMDDQTKEWAEQTLPKNSLQHKDSNGAFLSDGDHVVLIKDLDVKGANFTAKRGTIVRSIRLVADNSEHIEGKINGQQIVILSKFVKKS